MFEKLCSDQAVHICSGFGKCENFMPGDMGFFEEQNCVNFFGWKELH